MFILKTKAKNNCFKNFYLFIDKLEGVLESYRSASDQERIPSKNLLF